MQEVTHERVDRTKHVWKRRRAKDGGGFKCVICGGVTQAPTDNCDPHTYEPLTPEERVLCPMKDAPALP